jgi:hypothetical protein
MKVAKELELSKHDRGVTSVWKNDNTIRASHSDLQQAR